MRPVTVLDAQLVSAPAYREYVAHFAAEHENLDKVLRSFGLGVRAPGDARRRSSELVEELVRKGARVRNDGKSVVYGPLSPACARCRTGNKSVSEFISLACNRSCYFCFNPNQCDYERYRSSEKDWRTELESFERSMGGLDCIALTGGEPLLHPEEAVEFFAFARALSPCAHLRLYTSGFGADEALLRRLADAGLDEIRYSVKLDEPAERQAETLASLDAAVGIVPSVMVEMPVIPGTHDQMVELLRHLDEVGARGINLLEFCFPLNNADEYKARGFELVGDPYRIPYDYGYAGALPVAGSEELALELMLEMVDGGCSLGLHYCSLENKNTAQVYEQNLGGQLSIPGYRFSHRTFFYEAARAFGRDALELARVLDAAGIEHAFDEDGRMVMFDPGELAGIAEDARSCAVYLSSAIIETDEAGGRTFREVGLQAVAPDDYRLLAADAAQPIEEG